MGERKKAVKFGCGVMKEELLPLIIEGRKDKMEMESKADEVKEGGQVGREEGGVRVADASRYLFLVMYKQCVDNITRMHVFCFAFGFFFF